MTKEEIADLTSRTTAIANTLLQQLNGCRPNYHQKFYLGILTRQAVLLNNISTTLANEADNRLTSVFILFRCLLDDFITVLYFEARGNQEADIIKHTANAFHQRFKMFSSALRINLKYFEGKGDGLIDAEYEKKSRDEFLQNLENDKYFKNKRKFEFKNFPSVTSMIETLPKTDLGRANAHAFVLWKHLSHYVHYSSLTYQLEVFQESRTIEINQLKETLFYCYKTLVMSSDALKALGLNHEFSDSSNVWDELSRN